MVSAGMQAKDLTIQHVRHPGEWMPVAGIAALKCPRNILRGETARYMRVFGDVLMIIDRDKIVTYDRQIAQPGEEGERQTQQNLQISTRQIHECFSESLLFRSLICLSSF